MATAVPVTSAIDSLTQAIQYNIIPQHEYLLQGSILDSAVEHLLHRYFITNNIIHIKNIKFSNKTFFTD